MIYKHQEQPQQALECLQAICDQPPPPLSQADVWFLIGSVQETMEPVRPPHLQLWTCLAASLSLCLLDGCCAHSSCASVFNCAPQPAPEFAKQAYEHVLRLMQMHNDPKVARVYRQLGWVSTTQTPPALATALMPSSHCACALCVLQLGVP